MLKGGYKIIDLQDTNFTSGVGVIVKDIYEMIESTDKATLFSRFSIEDKEYNATYITMVVSGATYYGLIQYIDDTDSLKEIHIKIEQNDTVTFTVM